MCFSIFFCGCKLLSNLSTMISGTKIGDWIDYIMKEDKKKLKTSVKNTCIRYKLLAIITKKVYYCILVIN